MPTVELKSPWEVLVVDDEAAIRELLLAYFNSVGMRVTGAQDGRAAISALQRSNGRYGLVVTDLSLPGADGFAVLQAAKQANASCYVVIVTGYASLDSAIQAVRVGAYDYLAKPFSIGQLDVILNRITDRAALERENKQLGQHQQLQSHPAAAPHRPPLLAFPSPAAVPAARAADPASLEQRMSAMEAMLARIDARLR
jgi:DNA-binding NtrC family response regulator